MGPLGDIIYNHVKNKTRQGILGVKQNIKNGYRLFAKYSNPVEIIKAITPAIENRFPTVGVVLKKGTDGIDKLHQFINKPYPSHELQVKYQNKNADNQDQDKEIIRNRINAKRRTPTEALELQYNDDE